MKFPLMGFHPIYKLPILVQNSEVDGTYKILKSIFGGFCLTMLTQCSVFFCFYFSSFGGGSFRDFLPYMSSVGMRILVNGLWYCVVLLIIFV